VLARKPRVEFEDAFCHVIARGNQRRSTLSNDRDREAYLGRIERYRKRYDFIVLRLYSGVVGVGPRLLPASSVNLSHESVFSGLRASFCCQFFLCKLHSKNEASSNVPDVQSLRSVQAVQTVPCANYDASNLVASSRILGKNFPFDLRIPLTFSTKAKLPTATASDHRASRTDSCQGEA
jgi:hypothetical protein